jgi:hypothetical protein
VNASPRVGIAEDGFAMVVWEDWNRVAGGQVLWSAIVSTAGLSTPDLVTRSSAPLVTPTAFGMDAAGNGIALWLESGHPSVFAGPSALWTNRFRRNEGWSGPSLLATVPNASGYVRDDVYPIALAVGRDGAAVAIWQGPEDVQGAYMPAGGAWTAPTPVAARPPGRLGRHPIRGLRVRMDPSGRAIAAWEAQGGIEASTFDPRSGWRAPRLRATDGPATGFPPFYNHGPDLAIDAEGRGWVTWTEPGRVLVASVAPDGEWGEPITVRSTSNGTETPRIAVAPAGDLFVVWGEDPTPERRGGEEIWAMALSRPRP